MSDARISDYAIIGDGRSAALISRAGSIDWLCWPRFDSPSLFSALIDASEGGWWKIAPTVPARARRAYLEHTNVLVTEFETSGGVVRLIDLMPVFDEADKKKGLVPEHEVLRVVECVRGEVEVEVQFRPRPHYGKDRPRLHSLGALGVRVEDGANLYTFRTDATVHVESEHSLSGRFRLGPGERRVFSLSYDAYGPAVLAPLSDWRHAVERTTRWWNDWAGRCTYQGPFREEVLRSLLVLKLLAYAPSGAIVAAPTTSLPERIGGELNWDYRYCWVRDASLTVHALLSLGYDAEAESFIGWLLHTTRLTRPRLKVLYDVYGGLPRGEQLLMHLDGHRHSRPVRIRNEASTQLQLDTYGEVIDAVTQWSRRGGSLDLETKQMLLQFGHYTAENWWRPDQGIWEPRRGPQHHTHSRVLCWTALDRLVELHFSGHLPRLPVSKFEEQRSFIAHDVEKRSWSESLRSYTQVQNGHTVDAALLLMSWYGFTRADHPRMKSTFRKIRERLEVRPGLLYRNEESLIAGEGAFGICGFWAAEYLARGGGTLAEAERWFSQLLHYANDVGLHAEEIDPITGELLGNIPQGFTHIGLISAAVAIEQRRKEPVLKKQPRIEARI